MEFNFFTHQEQNNYKIGNNIMNNTGNTKNIGIINNIGNAKHSMKGQVRQVWSTAGLRTYS